MTEARLLDSAVWYAERLSWRVFPLHGVTDGHCTCGRADCENAGKHPRTPHGVTDATIDPGTIRSWWERWPDANVGVATGAASGIWVLDVDPRAFGDETLWELEHKHGELPTTVTCLTGGGGAHLYFRHTDGLKNQAGAIGAGLDLKADGGYVVAAPSAHLSGRRYAWEGASRPDEAPIAEAPEWLLSLARGAGGNGNGGSAGMTAPVAEKIPSGQRNTALTSLAGSMRRRGMAVEEIGAALTAVNARRCDPPLSIVEVRRIAESMRKYAPKETPTVRAENGGPKIRSVADIPSVLESASTEVLWVVEGFVAEGTVNVLTSEPGAGKTTVSLALAAAIACGVDFAGMKTARRLVLVLDRENTVSFVADVLKRLRAKDGEALRIWGGWLQEQAPDPASGIVLGWVASCDPKPLIVVDSLVAFHGGDENDSSETRRFMQSSRRLADMGATVLLLHHSGKSETSQDYRGSSDIKASADGCFKLTNIGPTNCIERLRIKPFKSRFLVDPELILHYVDGTFTREAGGGSQRMTDAEVLTELLKEHPGVQVREFESLATARGVSRTYARSFCENGIRDQRIVVEIGLRNTKRLRWKSDAEDRELF